MLYPKYLQAVLVVLTIGPNQMRISEPIGSVPPKINNINDKFQLMQIKLGLNFAMQCPGQAYPVAVVRLVSLSVPPNISG